MRISRKVLVDTNVLVNAVVKESPLHLVASMLVTDLVKKSLMVLSPQVMLECFNVLVGLGVPISQVMAYLYAFEDQPGIYFIFPGTETHKKAIQRASQNKVTAKRKIFDYFLVQTMMDNHIEKILTQNTRDFAGIEGIQAVNPFV